MALARHALSVEELAAKSTRMRREILAMAYRAKAGHLGSAFSMTDLLTCLYFHFLRYDPANPQWDGRDRFILSKGHACCGLYTVLAEAGFFPTEDLQTYLRDGSRLSGHASSMVPGIEFSTGSLGHGLSFGVGTALAGKLDNKDYRTIVLMSDGECNEGAVWEAALSAAQWELGNLLCIVDYNKIQSFGRTAEVMGLEPFADKWRAFRWHVQEVDGHDHAAILRGLNAAKPLADQPRIIIAHTVKGKGISFMENTVEWHYHSLNKDQFQKALAELA